MSDRNTLNGAAQDDARQGDAGRVLDIVSLYPKDMNIYGDSGNVLTVRRRAELYGYTPVVHNYNQGDEWPERVDMILGGGGQDQGQGTITDDLFRRSAQIHALADAGCPMLLICGMYQLFGEYFQTIEGNRLAGINVLDLYTVGHDVRMIGNLVEHTEEFGDVVGYENHSGQTFLGPNAKPWGRVDADGTGNNGGDHTEGARYNAVIGTYMHGSVLPKNPKVADYLIGTAATNRYGVFDPQYVDGAQEELRHLDELAARAAAVAASRPR
ncbi:MAG: glutamine amidotransferase [Bifidobacteriaceae bacterium]|nr:glutamine amidotransferase [Bifidobacteriaceae bacterium]